MTHDEPANSLLSSTRGYGDRCENQDPVLAQFVKEYDEAQNKAEVLRSYCALHPNLAGEFRRLVEAHEIMVLTSIADSVSSIPERLGAFQIVREIGKGGMGAIFEAIQEPLERRVAVKTIRSDNARFSPDLQDRFLREQTVLARLHHTHIVPIHAAGRDGPHQLQYFAMPYIDGASLKDMVQAVRRQWSSQPDGVTPSLKELAGSESTRSQPLANGSGNGHGPASTDGSSAGAVVPVRLTSKYLRSVARVMADAADALHHAHEAGVIHRDLKPSNVMVDRQEHCWVVDFGLAAYRAENGRPGPATEGSDLTSGTDLTAARHFLGTPGYAAPEQDPKDDQPLTVDQRADVWGLGVTLYEMLTLRPAFASQEQVQSSEPLQPRNLVRGLPYDLEAICRKAIHKDPGDRYTSAREFGEDLKHWLGHEPIQARPARTLRRAGLWAWRNPGWAAAIILAAVALIASAIGGTYAAEVERRHVRERQRALSLQQAQFIRLTPHLHGWSDDIWDLIRRTVKEQPPVNRTEFVELQQQAVASLAGLDARASKRFDAFGARYVAFDKEGKRLLMGTVSEAKNAKTLLGAKLWDVANDQLQDLKTIAAGPVGYRDDGTPIQLKVPGDQDEQKELVLMDLAHDRPFVRFVLPGALAIREITEIGMLPDGSLVGAPVRRADGQVLLVVWDGETGRVRHQFDGKPNCLAFSPDRTLLAAGHDDGRITVWSLTTGQSVAALGSSTTTVKCLTFGRDPRRVPADAGARGGGWLLAAGHSGGDLVVWDVRVGIPRAYYHGSLFDVLGVAFSPDGTTLASSGRNPTNLWDLETGRLLYSTNGGDPSNNFKTGLAFSPDGRKLVVGGNQAFMPGDVTVFDLDEGRGIQTLRGLRGMVEKVIVSTDARLVAGLSQNWTVAIWDRANGRLRRVLNVPHGQTADNAGLAFSPDGRQFAFSAGHEAKIWDLDTGRESGSWALPEGITDALAFHGPNQLLLCRSETSDAQEAIAPHLRPNDNPWVVRMRDLLRPNPRQPLWESFDFNRRVMGIITTADGTYFAVDGHGGPTGTEQRVVVFEGHSGKFAWPMQSWPESHSHADASVWFDPTGTIMTFRAGDVPLSLLTIATGAWRGNAGSGALGPGAKQWLQESADPRRFELHEQGLQRPQVTILCDSQRSSLPQFSSDGHYTLWGNSNGTVTVCDMRETSRRLTEIGLGW